ncbi:subtype B tannase [Williamsia maris]
MFDPTTFTEKTTTITTDAGDKKVVYKFFGPITYVTNPSDTEHQSLTISVPTSIDGTAVDATDAPIVFANSVGGYMPASVATATGVGEASMQMGGMGGAPAGGGAPPQAAGGEVRSGGNAMLNAGGGMVSLAKLAVAAGYVAVDPGCRGRSLTDAKGTYYGVAPAAIVDLKAAVRYLRSNKGRVPGNTDRIVSTGTSAGGALSALLGASGDSAAYDPYLTAVGAAKASDAVFASGDWCPITDLEHADGAYEWNWGTNPSSTGAPVDQTVSAQLRQQFATYQAGLKLNGSNDFGQITADNYNRYLLETYLQPSASRYLAALSATDRAKYLAANPFITYTDQKATFSWADYLTHVGVRKKSTPAFDAFDLSAGENNEFGLGTTKARHFTDYSMSKDTTGLTTRRLDKDIPDALNLMNPMYHLGRGDTERAEHWWIRLGTKDSDTALTVSANLAAAVSARGETVDHRMYWDAGHGANEDAADFITWVKKIAG